MSPIKSLKVLFVPLDAHGHINACVGIAQKIVAHGHRAIFALEQSWRGKVSSHYPGLEEVLYEDKTRPKTESAGANDHWIEFMKRFKVTFPLEPIEALKVTDLADEEAFINNWFNVHEELCELIRDVVHPDVLVVDTYATMPAALLAGVPWVWLTSAHPLMCLPSSDLPPASSGK